MSAPTVDHPDTTHDEPHPGPAEVLAALAQFSTPDTLAMIDQQVDEAYRESLAGGSPAPLRKVLDHWWYVVQVNRREIVPQRSASGRDELIAAWEAKHPGEKFPA